MTTIYVIRASQVSDPKFMNSVTAFANCTGIPTARIRQVAHYQGGSPLHIYGEELTNIKTGAIYLYKTGKINDHEFVAGMNKALDANLNFDTFKQCWNAMCHIEPATIDFLRKLEKAQQDLGFGLHVMGNTNPMHTQYISEQLAAAGINLHFSQTLSYKVGVLDAEPPKNYATTQYIDLRDTADIFTEINKLSHDVVATPKLKLASV
jgi:hypothetical protein